MGARGPAVMGALPLALLVLGASLSLACYVFPADTPDPCRGRSCNFGARCVAAADGRSATCECPSACPSYGDHAGSRPVCGSDGVDYPNQCELRRAACASSADIAVKFHGKCDPCEAVQCQPPEVCQLDEERQPVCRCGETCSLELTPVCATDGKTYANECTLRQQSCRSRSALRLLYRGKCSTGVNPCNAQRCQPGEECVINKMGIATCECPPECEPVMRPVCGRDGRTYPSACELRRAACLAKRHLDVAHAGACGGQGPCATHVCEFGAQCVERAGQAACVCPSCSAEFDPVCGSDGISYDNECRLRLEACQHRRHIKLLYKGRCTGCETSKCEHYSVCESDGNGAARCVCPQQCVGGGPAVCGTDGNNYASECAMRVAACRAKAFVMVAYKGDCDLCRDIKCHFGARCEAGECVCPTNCSAGAGPKAGAAPAPAGGEQVAEPVCASNMETYANECELQRASCLQPPGAPPLHVIFFGDCRERLGPALTTATPPSLQKGIPARAGAPPTARPALTHAHAHGAAAGRVVTAVAAGGGGGGGGGAMHPNGIPAAGVPGSAAEREACRDIRCDFDATCELGPDNFPRCSCLFDCSVAAAVGADTKPVCASDLRVYPSLCAMKMEGCQRQEELRLRPLELCEGMEVKPCNGESPLVDPGSGREFDCGSGPGRQDCPPDSYCHQTPHFARCCKKENSNLKNCEDSWFGCCPDGKTPALGADNAGCPSQCGCNKLGSYSGTCDPLTQQCSCKPGVGGPKCDRCEPGYWGLPKISEGHQGCIPCGCSKFGSVRDDCEQMTGRCVCKPGIQGQKCTICTEHNKILGPNGCTSDSTTPVPTSCSELTCYFGATCEEHGGQAECVCRSTCSEDSGNMQVVCGNDGETYGSECQLKLFACRYQKDIVVQALGPCKEEMFTGTEWPIKRSTAHRYTEPEDVSSPLYKSTRHLLIPDPPSNRFYYNSHNQEETNSLTSASLHHFGPGRNNANDIYYAAGYRPTPATIRVVTALLGDLCTTDMDCGVRNSRCVGGACLCPEGFAETSDRQECLANFHACNSQPCHQGGVCHDLLHGGFRCECLHPWGGQTCDTPVIERAYDIPAFDGRSYVRLKRLKAYNKLSLEVEFKTYANDGIILYNQQKADGTGDFVSLAIVNGFVEFRYNLGNGPVVITSLDKVEMKKFHRVIIKRYHRDGMLKLDDFEDVAGQSQGTLKALDLAEDAFIGYVPTNVSKVFENIGTTTGLMGCIRKLKVGRRLVELHEGLDSLVEEASGVHECGENPCSSMPCHHGGTCHAIDSEHYRCACTEHFTGNYCESRVNPCLSNPCTFGSTCEALPQGGFMCKCPPGRKGKSCQDLDAELHEIFVPDFSGNSYIEFPRLEGVSRAFSLEVWFMSRINDGVLIYNGQLANGKGDFISLNIVKGHVQFRFDLGSGIANITSENVITPGQWHAVKVTRVNQEGTLQLDEGVISKGSSGASLTELNLELPFYLGGISSLAEINRDANIVSGLDGAIQRLIVNGYSLDNLGERPTSIGNPRAHNIKQYQGLPCPPDPSSNPCLNGGICQPLLNLYACKCPLKYGGKHCEESVDALDMERPIRFTGETFYQYANKVDKSTNTSISTNETHVEIDNETDGMNESEEEEEEEEDEMYNEYEIDGEGDMYDEDDVDFFNKGRKGERTNRYEITFRTLEPNGLLLWLNKGKTLQSDYLSIAIVNGYLELSFNLGKQQNLLLAKSKVHVSDGSWHTALIHRRKRHGYIQVDGESPVRCIAQPGATVLNTNGRLWLGGAPTLPSGLPAPYYMGFKGCIDKIKVSRKPLDMLQRLGNDRTLIQFCHDNDV
ncbi:hypothetical protein R5R35_009634 [Gryllus longicercus]|uniref:Agrin n=1 Tax=Gryllus longicercus TaxID=2509291 RepID=A0AAN9VM08_9ORTH